MNEFKRTIFGCEFKVCRESIEYDHTVIPFTEIVDFYFYSGTTNGNGGADLKFHSHNRSITISKTVSLFTSRKTREELSILGQLFEQLYPIMLPNFISNSISTIRETGFRDIGYLKFSKTTVSQRPRTFLGLVTNEVPYRDAKISISNMIFIGALGTAPFLILKDERLNKSYKYSYNHTYQLAQSDMVKSRDLLHYIQTQNPF